MRKPSEPRPIEIDSKRLVAGAERVYPHIEFLTADDEGFYNVPLHNVGLGLLFEISPFPNFRDLLEQEDALSLRLAYLSKMDGYRLHDPDSPLPFLDPFIFLQKYGVFAGQVVRQRKEVVPTSLSMYSFAYSVLPSFSSCLR